MKTVIILGTDQFRRGVFRLLSTEYMELVEFGDNGPPPYHLNETKKQERGFPADVSIPSVDQTVCLEPGYTTTGVTDPARSGQLRSQTVRSSLHGEFILLRNLYEQFDIRNATLKQLTKRPHCQKTPGHTAELGVYKRDTAWKLNTPSLDRRLYLFNASEGFGPRDIEKEEAPGCPRVRKGELSDASETAILNRLSFPQNAVICKGRFPGTAQDLEDEDYALVSLGVDSYALLLPGLEYFYPRLSLGGMTLLHDYNSGRFRGTRQAIKDYEKCHYPLVLVLPCDLHGSAVIVRP